MTADNPLQLKSMLAWSGIAWAAGSDLHKRVPLQVRVVQQDIADGHGHLALYLHPDHAQHGGDGGGRLGPPAQVVGRVVEAGHDDCWARDPQLACQVLRGHRLQVKPCMLLQVAMCVCVHACACVCVMADIAHRELSKNMISGQKHANASCKP